MQAKSVYHGPISPHANFLVNRLVGTVILLVKNCRWGGGGGGKRAQLSNILVILSDC